MTADQDMVRFEKQIDRLQEVLDKLFDRFDGLDRRLQAVEQMLGRLEERGEVQDFSSVSSRVAVLEKEGHVFSGKWIVLVAIAGLVLPVAVSWIFHLLTHVDKAVGK